MSLQNGLIQAMKDLNEDQVLSCIRKMMAAHCTYNNIQMCLNTGIACVGKNFERGEYFIADLIVSGMIYRNALNLLMPLNSDRQPLPIGRIVIGVVEGDIHDIGKDIIVSLLRAEHFEVIDLGIDVKPTRFAYALRTYRPDVLLMSGVLTAAQESMRKTMELLRKEDLLKNTPVLIGGLCASEFQMKVVGADSWAYDTAETVAFCKKVIKEKYGTEK